MGLSRFYLLGIISLILIFCISCSSTKKITQPQLLSGKELKVYVIDSTKKVKVPYYDINNSPISVWFLKDSNKYMGFIVTGHAERDVCNQASIEVYNKLKEIGDKDAVFSFGIGYSIKQSQDWTSQYDALLKDMDDKFKEFESKYQGQVRVTSIDYNTYLNNLQNIENHIKRANVSKNWNTHIVEYKMKESPIVVPYYYPNTCNIIQFKIDRKTFGDIPTELVAKSYYGRTKEMIEFAIYYNNIIIDSLNILECDFIHKFPIPIPIINRNLEIKTDTFDIYPSTNFILTRDSKSSKMLFSFDKKATEEIISVSKAIMYLDSINVNIPDDVRAELEDWKKNNRIYKQQFNKDKQIFISQIKNEIIALKQSLIDIDINYNKFKEEQNFIIDGFLRGWPFDTYEDETNEQLDNWYIDKRDLIWESLLKQVPNSHIQGKLGGIFHADDVFFKVQLNGNIFTITPYKVLGRDFMQIIDKEKNIVYYQSPFNNRNPPLELMELLKEKIGKMYNID